MTERTVAMETTKPKTPDALYYIGSFGPDGKPLAWLNGIPARDLVAADIAGLDDRQLADAIASGLYSATARKAAPVKPANDRE